MSFDGKGDSITAFEKVDAPKGTYPWAWAHLWIGTSHASHRKPNEAIAQYREVAETMPTGPEKSMALLNLGLILRLEKGHADEAVRWLQAARDTPDISWFKVAYNEWGPLLPPRAPFSPSTTHAMANEGLKALGSGAKK